MDRSNAGVARRGKRPKEAVHAAIALLDRGWGRPTQTIAADRPPPRCCTSSPRKPSRASWLPRWSGARSTAWPCRLPSIFRWSLRWSSGQQLQSEATLAHGIRQQAGAGPATLGVPTVDACRPSGPALAAFGEPAPEVRDLGIFGGHDTDGELRCHGIVWAIKGHSRHRVAVEPLLGSLAAKCPRASFGECPGRTRQAYVQYLVTCGPPDLVTLWAASASVRPAPRPCVADPVRPPTRPAHEGAGEEVLFGLLRTAVERRHCEIRAWIRGETRPEGRTCPVAGSHSESW